MRSFKTFFAPNQLEGYQRGVMSYRYRGVPCFKSPIDIAVYLQLLHDAAPKTLIEIGSKAGGSALLFSDFAKMLELDCGVTSLDLDVPERTFEGVSFFQGDVRNLKEAFDAHDLYSLPRPWLIVEDSAHSAEGCSAALSFFAPLLRSGEWLVVEDGVLEDLGLSKQYGGGPNEAIALFMEAHPDVFEIGVRYCDMFGLQATYNPNGYLMRTATPFAVQP